MKILYFFSDLCLESDVLKSVVILHLIRRRQINEGPEELLVAGIHEP